MVFRLAEIQLEHRHNDGSWGELEPRPSHHDPAAHDPEREWASGTIYVCRTCAEEVRVSVVDEPAKPHE